MTMLATGASASLNLKAGYTLNSNGSGTVVFGPGPMNGQPESVSGTANKIGPFQSDQIMYLTGVQGLDFWTAPPSGEASITVLAGMVGALSLIEGRALTLTGAVGSAGTVQRYDSAGNAVGSAVAIAAGLQTLPAGSGTQRFQIICTSGSISASVSNAVLNSPQISQKGIVVQNPTNLSNVSIPYARSRNGTVLFDFSDIANWPSLFGGVTRTLDPTMAKRGASALKLVFGVGATTDGIKKTFATPFIIQSGTAMDLVFYNDTATYVAGVTAVIKFSSDGNATKSLAYTITNAYIRPGWNTVPLRAGEDGTFESQAGTTWVSVGGQAWGDQFNYVHISFTGMDSKICWMDSFVVGAKAIPRWSFSTDSPDSTILSVIAPAFAANGWVGTVFLDGDLTTLTTNKNMILSLVNNYGWDFGIQGIGHTSYSGREAQLAIDLDICLDNCVALGLPTPRLFAYPSNVSTVACDLVLVSKGFTWRRGAGNPILTNVGVGCPNAPDGLVRSGWNQLLGTNLNTGTAYTQLVNRNAANKFYGGIQHYFTHNAKPFAPDGLGIDLTQFYQWCEMMKQAEFSDGLQNVRCSDSKLLLDSEVFI